MYVLANSQKSRTVSSESEYVDFTSKGRTVRYISNEKDKLVFQGFQTKYFELAPRAEEDPAVINIGEQSVVATAFLFAAPNNEASTTLPLRIVASATCEHCK